MFTVPHIKNLHEDKLKHDKTHNILKFLCDKASKIGGSEEYKRALVLAVENNNREVIEHITKSFRQSIRNTRDNKYTLYQLSIMNRCEHAYNFLVHEAPYHKDLHHSTVFSDHEDNLLHLVGKLAPQDKLNMVTGATLQMQRELQWFQEVGKLVPIKEREARNNEEKTPTMVFRNEHEDLRQKGEEWMKHTANSYTITAALIITMVFAGAITVPGGNNGDTGEAIYKTKPAFIIFIVSDAIALFTSTTSLLLFLSILTARYAIDDFLYKLPKRLILGLIMLFMSVVTMLIAFSATLYIMAGQENSWILIPISIVTCLPIVSFVTLQLPLLYDLLSSTYGRGIFVKRAHITSYK
ncbi:putative PGG domain-containing protein [Helianthus annuus]|nr:putative PGG domain-containing protein [Helianthus annuus]